MTKSKTESNVQSKQLNALVAAILEHKDSFFVQQAIDSPTILVGMIDYVKGDSEDEDFEDDFDVEDGDDDVDEFDVEDEDDEFEDEDEDEDEDDDDEFEDEYEDDEDEESEFDSMSLKEIVAFFTDELGMTRKQVKTAAGGTDKESLVELGERFRKLEAKHAKRKITVLAKAAKKVGYVIDGRVKKEDVKRARFAAELAKNDLVNQ